MVIAIRGRAFDIQTDDGVWFNMNPVQMEQIRLAIEIIENIQADVEIDTLRLTAKGIRLISDKED